MKKLFKQRKYRKQLRDQIYSCNKRELVDLLPYIIENQDLTEKSKYEMLLLGLKRIQELPSITGYEYNKL